MGQLKNNRHEMFCQYYITELNGKLYNATIAAQKAGFSKKTAYSIGHRLLSRDDIQERIAELKEDAMKRIGIDQLYILQKYKKIIDDDIRNYLSFKSIAEEYIDFVTGEPGVKHTIDIEIKASADIDTWNVAEVSVGKDGQFKFKLHDKQKALNDLREYAKMAVDEVQDEQDAIIDNFTPVLGMIKVALENKLDE